MTWLGHEGDEVAELRFKQHHMSTQKGIKTHGQKGMDLEMKK